MSTTDESTVRVRVVTVDAGHEGQRIDNFLNTLLKGVPRSLIYRVLRRGEVRVNKGRVKPDYRLRHGDQVRVPPVRMAEGGSTGVPDGVCRRLAEAIIHEDGELMVLDKPAGLAVHAGSGLSFGVIEGLRQLRPQATFLELVHRLDRDTSGCLLLAKSRPVLLALQEQGKHGEMDKRYLALVEGQWPDTRTMVTAPLRKNVISSGERMVLVSPDGRESRTEFKVVERYADASLVEARLHTGRTHQIRVHAAHSGHPLAGDAKYGNEIFNKRLRAEGLKRMFLHAQRLAFRHPGRAETVQFDCPLPDDLAQLLQHRGPAQ